MKFKFKEVFKVNVSIANDLPSMFMHLHSARIRGCDEMRIIVSSDPHNPGIDLVFGKLELDEKNEIILSKVYFPLGGFFLSSQKSQEGKDKCSMQNETSKPNKEDASNCGDSWREQAEKSERTLSILERCINILGRIETLGSKSDSEEKPLSNSLFKQFYRLVMINSKGVIIEGLGTRLEKLNPKLYEEFVDKLAAGQDLNDLLKEYDI